MMRIAVVLSFLLAAGSAVRGGDIYRYQVERGSEMEKELGYELSVEDKHDESRATGMDEVFPIEGPAPEYSVKFHATAAGKLKDLFELDLALTDANRTVLQVPLAIRSRYNKENKVEVRFLIKKDLINQTVLDIRCAPWMRVHPEAVYSIRLGDYAPGYEPTETQRIAELRKRHPSIGLLAWHPNKNPQNYSTSLSVLTV